MMAESKATLLGYCVAHQRLGECINGVALGVEYLLSARQRRPSLLSFHARLPWVPRTAPFKQRPRPQCSAGPLEATEIGRQYATGGRDDMAAIALDAAWRIWATAFEKELLALTGSDADSRARRARPARLRWCSVAPKGAMNAPATKPLWGPILLYGALTEAL